MKITIYAANANGRSPNIVLEGFTLKVAELQVGKPHSFCLQKNIALHGRKDFNQKGLHSVRLFCKHLQKMLEIFENHHL